MNRPTPPLAPAALLLGGAACVWDDVAALEEMIGRPWPGVVIAANNVGYAWPRPLHHWVSMHPERFHRLMGDGEGDWIAKRRANGYPDGYLLWGRPSRAKSVDRVIEQWGGLSSGGFTATVAVDGLSLRRSVFCGVPMDDGQGHFHRTGKKWARAREHLRRFREKAQRQRMEGLVKSMSGETRKLLGAPTLEWLAPALEKAA